MTVYAKVKKPWFKKSEMHGDLLLCTMVSASMSPGKGGLYKYPARKGGEHVKNTGVVLVVLLIFLATTSIAHANHTSIVTDALGKSQNLVMYTYTVENQANSRDDIIELRINKTPGTDVRNKWKAIQYSKRSQWYFEDKPTYFRFFDNGTPNPRNPIKPGQSSKFVVVSAAPPRDFDAKTIDFAAGEGGNKVRAPNSKPTPIPEFPTMALPVLSILGIVFWISRRS